MYEQEKNISNRINTSNKDVKTAENWSESNCSSSYSDTDSSIPDWDSSVDEITGEVFYIECYPCATPIIKDVTTEQSNVFSRNQNRRSGKGRLLKLLRRRESKRYNKKNIKVEEMDVHNISKVTFQDFQEGEEREVILKIEDFIEGDNLTESLLGINVGTLLDGRRLMVAGFLHGCHAKYEKNIKIGDWLKSIDGIDVNFQNINTVLQQLTDKDEVLLRLQRVAGVDVTKDPPANVLSKQSHFVRQLTSFNEEEDERFQEHLCKFPIGFLFIDTDKLDETGPEYQEVVYCYPRPMRKNALCNSKGIFLTLRHLLKDVTGTSAKITSIFHNNILCLVTYQQVQNHLLLLMLPDVFVKPFELIVLLEEISRMFIFTWNTFEYCFSNNNINQIDHFFSMFFAKTLNDGLWLYNLELSDNINASSICDYHFENVLHAVHCINLPKDAMIQVEDALTELEACDYREWNEEPLDCQRIFTVLGSAWYHSGYLIASHFIYEDVVDINCFCKHLGLLHLSKTESVKKILVWREVFPTSCRFLKIPIFTLPEARRYLLIVGCRNDLLVVILEAGGCTEPPKEGTPPDPFYVEEAQAALAHIQELGIPELADRFIDMNPGSEITLSRTSNQNKKNDVLNFSRSPQGQLGESSSSMQKQEVPSILKRRGNDQSRTIFTNTESLSEDDYDEHSEDAGSQDCESGRSEHSDDIAMPPRLDKRNIYESDSDESNDGDNTDDSPESNNSFDVDEIKQMLLFEIEDIQPVPITKGNYNVLYHYVQFDKSEGILLSPPECHINSGTRNIIISNFRKCCQHIHGLFQNTMRFKTMTSQEMARSALNKSLIAIKEYGTMFECPVVDQEDSRKEKIAYWVIGRLFFNPEVREIFVCYNDAISQNAVELAFKLNMGSYG